MTTSVYTQTPMQCSRGYSEFSARESESHGGGGTRTQRKGMSVIARTCLLAVCVSLVGNTITSTTIDEAE